MIKVVLFDIYGTLIDIQTDEYSLSTYEPLSRYLQYKHIYLSPDQVKWLYHEEFARRLGQEPPRPASLADFQRLIGTTPGAYPDADIRDVFKAILSRYGHLPEANLGHEAADLSHLFRSTTRKRMFIYPTVVSGLHALAEKYRLGIVSNAQEAFTPEELDLYGLREHFDTIVLSSEVQVKKPNPRIFFKALEKMAASPSEAVFVGNDLTADILGASAIGMKTILIGHPGYSIPGVTPSAVIPAPDPAEVLRLIDSWKAR